MIPCLFHFLKSSDSIIVLGNLQQGGFFLETPILSLRHASLSFHFQPSLRNEENRSSREKESIKAALPLPYPNLSNN